MFVIPDTIDPEKFRVKIDNTILCKIRKRFNIPNNKKIVTYIGRLRSEKGWQDLPEITEAVCDADAFMLICGDGPDRRKLENAMPINRKENGWCITGFLDPDEIKAVLQIADVFVMPSRREAFGSVLLEVMAAGVPAIAYAVGGIVEVAGTPKAIRLIPPMDKFAFIKAILELLTDPKQCEYLIEQGHRRVEDFSIKHATEETLPKCFKKTRCDEE
jgi:glycosyltransferase involved in cell wall biosynthesis